LSLEVGKKWKLANVRMARIFHDSQPAEHKSDHSAVGCMEVVNRHFVMTEVMGKRSFLDCARLALWELFSIASAANDEKSWKNLPSLIAGKFRGLRRIASRKNAA